MPTLLEAKDKVRELSKKALDTVQDDKLTTAEKKAVLDQVEPEIKTWTEEVQSLERFEDTRKSMVASLQEGGGSQEPQEPEGKSEPWRKKSLGQQFVEHANYKSLIEGGVSNKTGKWSTGGIELKTALTEGTSGFPGPGNSLISTPTVLPGMTDIRFQPLTVADLFPSGSTNSPLLRYLVESAITNAAATVAELGLKPESAITFSKVDETLKKIATFLPVSDEMLEDFEQIRSYLDSRLELFVKLQEEVQLLRGDGAGTNLVGILNRAGLATSIAKGTSPSLSGDNDMDAIYRQITAIRTTSFLEPETVVIDPLGWQNIVLSKDSQGRYLGQGPFMSVQTPMVWGKPVVPTTAMPANTALVGAFRAASQVFRKGGITVEASNSHADFFQRDETAIRAHERLLLAVYRPGAFGTVTNL
jgi:HK97 family phage major capsid protein